MRKPALFVPVVMAAVGLFAACDKKSEGPASTTAPTTSAPVVATTSAEAQHVAPTASASTMAAASASAEAADGGTPGEVHLHVATVKVTSGKVDRAKDKFHKRAAVVRKKCVDPAVKKTPDIDGSVKITIEFDADGKVTKQTPKVDGKIPDDLVKCLEKSIEKDMGDFDTDGSKAKLDVQYDIGPNAGKDAAGDAKPEKK